MRELLIKQEFRSIIPSLAPEELRMLEESILEEGVRDAIVTWNGYIVDGHNRYDIITKHGITDYRVVSKTFSDIDEVKFWIKKNQIGRRNIAPYLRGEYYLEIQEWQERRRLARAFKGNQFVKPEKSSFQNSENTTAELAKTLNVSTDTASRIIQIHAKAPEALKEKLRTGEVSINEGYREINKKPVHVGYGTGEYEWYTPVEYIEAARLVMGGIDCDPASSDIANEVIGASRYFTVKDDGRKQVWGERVWLNPPYFQPVVSDFCSLLVDKYRSGEVKQACVLLNNATETTFIQEMLRIASVVCFVKGRVKFLDPEGNPGAPLQGQALIYLGTNLEAFARKFGKFGVILYARR